jgi:hypothetical protein
MSYTVRSLACNNGGAMFYLKLLDANRQSPYRWWIWPEPLIWAPWVDKLRVCVSGYHLLQPEHLRMWLDEINTWCELKDKLQVWVVQTQGAALRQPHPLYLPPKVVVHSARLLFRLENSLDSPGLYGEFNWMCDLRAFARWARAECKRRSIDLRGLQ